MSIAFPAQASTQYPPAGPSAGQSAAFNYEKIVVKFREGTGVRLRNGLLTAPQVATVSGIRALLASVPGLTLNRHFSRPEATLDQERQAAIAASGKTLADLNLYYTITLPPGTSQAAAQALVTSLLSQPSVQTAYIQPIPVPAGGVDLLPPTPLYQFNQGYLKVGPQGVDASYAWGIPGGKGQGVRIIDIEGGWELDHEDLSTSSATDLLYGINYGKETGDPVWYQHGSAVLGEMIGIHNGYGVTGIVPGAEAKVISIWTSLGSANIADAISQAVANTQPGDLILVELQQAAPPLKSPCNVECTCPPDVPWVRYIPVEYYQAEFDAIQNATAQNRIVIEAAGNGYNDLDDPVWGGAFNIATRDSGAIMVGAGFSGTGGNTPARRPHCYSNFGSRVDVQGWGDNIYTAGYGFVFDGGGDVKQYYTGVFNGTSGASPIVTAVAAALQGIAKDRGSLISPADMRNYLKTYGYAQASSTRNIGPMPNLRLAIEGTFPTIPIQVINTNDSGAGSLREAINQANTDPDTNTITFNIPGAGPHTINLLSALPEIIHPVVIDGYTQPGAARATMTSGGVPIAAQIKIELNGAGAGLGATGLYISAGSSIVRGLAINRFAGAAIFLTTNGNNIIEGNYLGTDVTGSAALPNLYGVRISSSSLNTVGGLTIAERNIISGNNSNGVMIGGSGSANNTVRGNYVGTNASGSGSLGNGKGIAGGDGIQVSVGDNNKVLFNLISDNGSAVYGNGVTIFGTATNTEIYGNYIGTNAAGSGALGNFYAGVYVASANNTIGSSAPNAILPISGNVISGNGSAGIFVTSTSTITIIGNYIGTNAAGTAAIPNAVNGITVSNSASQVTIGGLTPTERNVISGNTGHGILLNGPNNQVINNWIGLNGGGTNQLGNTQHGVFINNTSGNFVGSADPASRNLLSGNAGNGVLISGVNATNNQVINNYIGTDALGTSDYGNALNGVLIDTSAANNQITLNTIAFNDMNGAVVDGAATSGNLIITNSIFSNTGLGIDLVSGGNLNRPAPVLTNVTSNGNLTVYGTLTGSAPGVNHRLDFYANAACDPSGHGEGQTHIGFINQTTNASGNLNFTATLSAQPAGTRITATATDAANNTSEFSNCFLVNDGSLPPVIISPKDVTVTNLNPEFRWNEVFGSIAYTIQLSDVTAGTVVYTKLYLADACTAGICSATPSEVLTTNHLYAWYISAASPDGIWGPFGPPGVFVASVPPGKPTMLSPAGIYVPDPETLTPEYQWTEAPGSILYFLVVYDLNTFSLQFSQVYDTMADPTICQAGICSVTPDGPGSTLTNGNPYGVYVAGISFAGPGPWSDGVAFYIFLKPAKPIQVAPSGLTTDRPFYQWNAVQGTTDYGIVVYNSVGEVVLTQWVSAPVACATTPCQFQQPTSLPPGDYVWFMYAWNPAGFSPPADGLIFTVPVGPPAAPTFRP